MKQQLFHDMTLSVSSFFRILFPGVFDVTTWHLPGLIPKNTFALFLHSPVKKVIPLSKSTELLTTIVFIYLFLPCILQMSTTESRRTKSIVMMHRQSTFWLFLSLRCNLLSQRSFVSIVGLQVISFFNVSKMHFHSLRFTTPLCINCRGGLSSGHHCDCTALCFHNISCFELVIIRLRLYRTFLSQHLLFELRGRNRLFIRFFLLLYCTLLSQHLLFWISHHLILSSVSAPHCTLLSQHCLFFLDS